jgi:hypothetical protein
VRSPSGIITTFDVPAFEGSGTYAFSINDAGVVAGFFFQDGESFSFIRGPSGVFDTFAAGPGNPGLTGTRAYSINNAYSVTGFYSTATAGGTYATGVNDARTIAGYYIDTHSASHGFLRRAVAP